MDAQKAKQLEEVITNIAGCVSTIQLIDAGVVPNCEPVIPNGCGGWIETGNFGRAQYCELLSKHQKKLRKLLNS